MAGCVSMDGTGLVSTVDRRWHSTSHTALEEGFSKVGDSNYQRREDTLMANRTKRVFVSTVWAAQVVLLGYKRESGRDFVCNNSRLMKPFQWPIYLRKTGRMCAESLPPRSGQWWVGCFKRMA